MQRVRYITGIALALVVVCALTAGAAQAAKSKHKLPITTHQGLAAFNKNLDDDRSKIYGVSAEIGWAVPNGVSTKSVCKGKVKFTLTRKSKTIKKFTANVRQRTFDHNCVAWKGFRLPMDLKGKTVKLKVEFAGNSYYRAYKRTTNSELPNY